MSQRNKKQFGVWTDSQTATIIGRENAEAEEFTVIGHVKNVGSDGNSNENAGHNMEIAATHKFFKEIAMVMPNIDQIHITGTGQIQEQFINFLAETPQYKNVEASESTSNRMSDDESIAFFTAHFK